MGEKACPRCTSVWGMKAGEVQGHLHSKWEASLDNMKLKGSNQNGASLPIEIIADQCFKIFLRGNDCQVRLYT